MAEEPEGKNGDKLPNDWSHQIRQVVAGLLGIAIACFDRWYYPDPTKGFSPNIDELVLLISLGVVAGAAGLFKLPNQPK